ncbi:hypothetical protein ACFQX6_64785 [Streptosporangium lutulentum]
MDHLDRAEEIARSLGQEREATGFLFSRFLAHAQGIQLDAAGRLARGCWITVSAPLTLSSRLPAITRGESTSGVWAISVRPIGT